MEYYTNNNSFLSEIEKGLYNATMMQFSRTKMCPGLLKNSICTKGQKCLYAHSVKELRVAPNLAMTKLCPRVKIGCLCKDYLCRYAHKPEDLRHTDGLFKTKMCHMFKRGKCNGEFCRHAHGIDELNYYRRISRKIANANDANNNETVINSESNLDSLKLNNLFLSVCKNELTENNRTLSIEEKKKSTNNLKIKKNLIDLQSISNTKRSNNTSSAPAVDETSYVSILFSCNSSNLLESNFYPSEMYLKNFQDGKTPSDLSMISSLSTVQNSIDSQDLARNEFFNYNTKPIGINTPNYHTLQNENKSNLEVLNNESFQSSIFSRDLLDSLKQSYESNLTSMNLDMDLPGLNFNQKNPKYYPNNFENFNGTHRNNPLPYELDSIPKYNPNSTVYNLLSGFCNDKNVLNTDTKNVFEQEPEALNNQLFLSSSKVLNPGISDDAKIYGSWSPNKDNFCENFESKDLTSVPKSLNKFNTNYKDSLSDIFQNNLNLDNPSSTNNHEDTYSTNQNGNFELLNNNAMNLLLHCLSGSMQNISIPKHFGAISPSTTTASSPTNTVDQYSPSFADSIYREVLKMKSNSFEPCNIQASNCSDSKYFNNLIGALTELLSNNK